MGEQYGCAQCPGGTLQLSANVSAGHYAAKPICALLSLCNNTPAREWARAPARWHTYVSARQCVGMPICRLTVAGRRSMLHNAQSPRYSGEPIGRWKNGPELRADLIMRHGCIDATWQCRGVKSGRHEIMTVQQYPGTTRHWCSNTWSDTRSLMYFHNNGLVFCSTWESERWRMLWNIVLYIIYIYNLELFWLHICLCSRCVRLLNTCGMHIPHVSRNRTHSELEHRKNANWYGWISLTVCSSCEWNG